MGTPHPLPIRRPPMGTGAACTAEIPPLRQSPPSERPKRSTRPRILPASCRLATSPESSRTFLQMSMFCWADRKGYGKIKARERPSPKTGFEGTVCFNLTMFSSQVDIPGLGSTLSVRFCRRGMPYLFEQRTSKYLVYGRPPSATVEHRTTEALSCRVPESLL